jgi:hypothetical protein
MLDIQDSGIHLSRTVAGESRRSFLRAGAASVLGLSLAQWLQLEACGQTQPAKAKSVIEIWQNGGASHLDTFDPKPEAGADYCGPLKTPLDTNVPGIKIGELMPLMAKQADKFCMIRSFTHPDFGHETATYTCLTGTVPSPDLVYPSMGAVVALKRGYEAGYQGSLPPYITLTSPLGRFSDSGFLGSKYRTFATYGDPNDPNFRVQGMAPPGGMAVERVQERRALLDSVDALAGRVEQEGLLRDMETFEEKAYSVVLGEARTAFDLTKEPDDVRNKYGRHMFGQSCLLARRLVENGVPFITINMPGWDTHTDNFNAMKNLAGMLDSGLASLLEDLAQRGLLASTIVLCHSEFGRTPKVDWAPPWNGGRHHYPLCYTCVVAGGGFRGGVVLGSSDAKGEFVKERPVYPWDVTASIYKLLGIEPTDRLPHPQGCVAYVTPVASGSLPKGGMLTEIM